MIPVLGVPILTGPDLLIRMLASVNVPVGRTYVVDNGGVVDGSLIDADVYVPGHNLGVAASWNNIISSNQDAPWWAIVNHDLTFSPGDLGRLTEHMETVGGVAMLGTFSAFGIDRAAVDAVGLFDENFHPAYWEDNDFDYRCRLKGVSLIALPFGGAHATSSTLASNPRFQDRNRHTFSKNRDYFFAKWGGGPYQETYLSPFNQGGDPAEWSLDVHRLADQRWSE
jgi:GT2 family glycosyltransferase